MKSFWLSLIFILTLAIPAFANTQNYISVSNQPIDSLDLNWSKEDVAKYVSMQISNFLDIKDMDVADKKAYFPYLLISICNNLKDNDLIYNYRILQIKMPEDKVIYIIQVFPDMNDANSYPLRIGIDLNTKKVMFI